MDIIIKAVYFRKKVENPIGYTAEFVDTLTKENVECELPVIIGSHTDTFLKINKLDVIKMAMVDGRIIALCDKSQNIELIKDHVDAHFARCDKNENMNYIKEQYGLREDTLEATILDALRDSYLRINEVMVTSESVVGENGLILDFSSDVNTTRLAFPKNTDLEEYILGIVGTDDLEDARVNLLGRAFYVVDYALEVIAIVDKNTKKMCVLRANYDKDGNLEGYTNLKKIEDLGIAPESLDIRVKRLINKEESK